jgi:predicted amidophosphoribosyltransferase
MTPGVTSTNDRFRAAIRAVASATVDLVLPAVCAACGRPSAAVCGGCLGELSSGPTLVAPGVAAVAPYEGVPRELVLAFKERGRRDLGRSLGRALAAAVPRTPGARPASDGTWWLVPVPSRPAAARARGGPHVLALARWCAATLAEDGGAAAVAPALRLSSRARDAVGLDRADRVRNLRGRVHLAPDGAPEPGTPVVLLDDVVTTGATVRECSRVLAGHGVEVTAALTVTATPRGFGDARVKPRNLSPTWVVGELKEGGRR